MVLFKGKLMELQAEQPTLPSKEIPKSSSPHRVTPDTEQVVCPVHLAVKGPAKAHTQVRTEDFSSQGKDLNEKV